MEKQISVLFLCLKMQALYSTIIGTYHNIACTCFLCFLFRKLQRFISKFEIYTSLYNRFYNGKAWFYLYSCFELQYIIFFLIYSYMDNNLLYIWDLVIIRVLFSFILNSMSLSTEHKFYWFWIRFIGFTVIVYRYLI
jgi:hypothetical protein